MAVVMAAEYATNSAPPPITNSRLSPHHAYNPNPPNHIISRTATNPSNRLTSRSSSPGSSSATVHAVASNHRQFHIADTCEEENEYDPLGDSAVPMMYFNPPSTTMVPIRQDEEVYHGQMDGIVQFHRYNSEDIIYDNPKRQAKIVGGKYLKGDQLGEGSYSKVREMLDVTTLCRRAVKIMKQRRLRRIPNGEANVQREIKILKKLNHNNVISLIETFEDTEKQKLYVVLEYCVGALQEMLDKTPGNKFSPWQAHLYFVQLINGLEYLHGRGVVHKDIKPGNLLLTTNETVKITDFGVAEELERFTHDDQVSTCQGSPAFQPPEIASGQHDSWSGFKADLWAAGVTLFHFTTGKFPFEGDNIYKLFASISTGVFKMPRDLSHYLKDLLNGMLKKDPDQRFVISEIRAHPWFIYKHSRPLPGEIVRFPPYADTLDNYRGTTVLPYLETFFNYGQDETGVQNQDRRTMEGCEDINWMSEDDLFSSEAQSMASVQSADHFAGNIVQRRSRVSSQDNVLFPMSKSVDELGKFRRPSSAARKKKSFIKMKKQNSKVGCAQQ